MSNELATAYQLNASGSMLDFHLLIILVIMLVTGLLGGVANHYLVERDESTGPRDKIKYPILGVIAALTVPLFLNMISSTLLEGARTKPVDFFAFAGFCLLYVIMSRRWFDNVAQHLFRQFDQVRRDLKEIRQEVREPQHSSRPETPAPAPAAEKDELREAMSYHDVEILRGIAEEGFVYGNLAAICERTGLARDFVSQRLMVLKSLGVIETRINDRNVLHWALSVRGKTVLGDILEARDESRTA